jgi:uncharacterized protein
MITADYDDNKFVDAAISSGADYIVTNDGHFRALQTITFPSVSVVFIQAFMALLPTERRF